MYRKVNITILLLLIVGCLVVGASAKVDEKKSLAGGTETTKSLDKTTSGIIITGDVMLGRDVKKQLVANKDILKNVRSVFNQASLTIINLEAPLTNTNEHLDKEIYLKANPDSVKLLKSINVSVACLANNHISDYKEQGMKDTFEVLKQNNIDKVGAGFNLEEASSVVYKHVDGKTVAILNYSKFNKNDAPAAGVTSPGQAYYDENVIKDRLKEASEKSDFQIVIFHFGREYQDNPDDNQVKISQLAIDSGADLVVGHHPHVTQGVEKYKGKLIFYSLGNMIFDQETFPRDRSMFLKLDLNNNTYTLYPYTIDKGAPKMMNIEDARKFFDNINNLRDPLISLSGNSGVIKAD